MRTDVDTSAKAGMLYAATPHRTWCQRCTTKAHIPPPFFFVLHGATREKVGEEKDRDTHQGGGRGKVRAREKGEQRKGKRATKPRTKQGVASSRARDARREGGTAGTRHTAGTTPHQSTGEGSTRGTREKRHRAPRHAPHRHHTHRTQPHPRPQHVASEPRQPAQRAGSRGRGSAWPQSPLTTVKQVTTLPWHFTLRGHYLALYMGYMWDRVYHIPFPC